MRFFVHIGGERMEVEVAEGSASVDGEPVDVDLPSDPGSPVRAVLASGRSLRLLATRSGRGVWEFGLGGVSYRAEVLDPAEEAVRAARKVAGVGSGPAPLRAPMPGLVVRVEVAEGDEVEVGQGLVIVEAMKMENELRAEAPGRVSAVRASEGTAVEKDEVLLEFEPLETEEAEEG